MKTAEDIVTDLERDKLAIFNYRKRKEAVAQLEKWVQDEATEIARQRLAAKYINGE